MSATINSAGQLAGKVAVITGASRGIGAAVAYRYTQEGAKVVVSARTLQDGDYVLEGGIKNVASVINNAGGSALAVRADLNLEAHRVNLIEETRSAFGEVDILVNNGAVTYYAPVHEFSEKRYRLMMDVQVYAAFHLCQLVLPSMIDRRDGRIVNVSSYAAIHPAKDAGGRGGSV